MRPFECRAPRLAHVSLGFLLALVLALPLAGMRAEERGGSAGQGVQRPASSEADAGKPDLRARLHEVRPLFDDKDEAAALEAVHVALTEVGDGSSYVWYRHGGRLSGVVQPTQSFKDTLGRVCRHIVVTLSDASRQKRTEGIACRLADGAWELDG